MTRAPPKVPSYTKKSNIRRRKTYPCTDLENVRMGEAIADKSAKTRIPALKIIIITTTTTTVITIPISHDD